tara:strand:- start:415 stop:1698 length:1284 start_codon:yes stop_codon:yes gene_type:complete
MEATNHELNRRVTGLRALCFVIAAIAMFTLIRWIIAPTAQLQYVNQGQMLLNLFTFIIFSLFIFLLKNENYRVLSIATVLLFPAYYFIFDLLIDFDNEFVNPSAIGLGRSLNTAPIVPITFVVLGTLFLRGSMILLFIGFFTLMFGFEAYKVITDERTFFESDFDILQNNGFAIDTAVFVIWINIWIIISIVCWSVVYLVDKLMKDVVKFEKSTAQFGRYFSPSIREKIQEADLEVKDNENNSQLVAVLFTDIDGFTELSEKMSSREIIDLLSEYQDKMIKPIFKNSGTVDKFIGDSVMATFGTPVTQGNDAQNAFNCAREMQIAMRQWVKEREDKKLPVITHRIGIHFGNCVVGNIGNKDRKEFTVIGDVVNVANRVCDICKDFKCDLMITEELKNRLNETINGEEVKDYSIRGRKDKVTLYKVST